MSMVQSPCPTSLQLIYMHWMNSVVNYCGPFEYEVDYCERLKRFLEANLEWMQEEMESNRGSMYWHQVGLGFQLLPRICHCLSLLTLLPLVHLSNLHLSVLPATQWNSSCPSQATCVAHCAFLLSEACG